MDKIRSSIKIEAESIKTSGGWSDVRQIRTSYQKKHWRRKFRANIKSTRNTMAILRVLIMAILRTLPVRSMITWYLIKSKAIQSFVLLPNTSKSNLFLKPQNKSIQRLLLVNTARTMLLNFSVIYLLLTLNQRREEWYQRKFFLHN